MLSVVMFRVVMPCRECGESKLCYDGRCIDCYRDDGYVVCGDRFRGWDWNIARFGEVNNMSREKAEVLIMGNMN